MTMMYNPPMTIERQQGTEHSCINKFNIANPFCLGINICQIQL